MHTKVARQVDLLRSTGGGARASQRAQPFSRTLNGSGIQRRREQSEFKEVHLVVSVAEKAAAVQVVRVRDMRVRDMCGTEVIRVRELRRPQVVCEASSY